MNFPDKTGHYGEFGGRFVPETLMTLLSDLEKEYRTALKDVSFRREFRTYLEEYAGRPTRLYLAERLSRELTTRGFTVFPSQTNFILVRPPKFSARTWLQKLRDRKILVRWFSDPSVRDYLRITIGTPQQAAALLKAARAILQPTPK